jgi:hypothetical protein
MDARAVTSRFRPVAAGLVGAFAVLLLPFSILALWVDGLVTNTDRYVATVGPLAEDPDIKLLVERRLDDAIVARVDIDKQEEALRRALGGRLDNAQLSRLRPLLVQIASDVVHGVVHGIVDSSEFANAWADANRSAHEQLVAVLSGENTALLTPDGRVSIQLATLINAVTSELADRGLAVAGKVPTAEASFTIMQSGDVDKAQRAYRFIDSLGWLIPVALVALAAGTIALARHRRRALTWLAAGFACGAVLLAVGLRIARHVVLDAASGNADPTVARAVWDIVVADLRTEVRGALLVAAAGLIATWVAGSSRGAVGMRSASVRAGRALAATRSDPAFLAGLVGVTIVLIALIWIV